MATQPASNAATARAAGPMSADHDDGHARVQRVELLSCDGGWRNYHFLKLTTSDGVVGWSEFDEAYGPPGVAHLIDAYTPLVVGSPVFAHELLYQRLAAIIRPAPQGPAAEALGALENALLDAKARTLGVPCATLLGGQQRDTIPVYWSHCTTWRINHPRHYAPAITDLDGVKKAGEDARKAGYRAVKTNLFLYDDGVPRQWMAGFGVPHEPGRTITPRLIGDVRTHLTALREGLGPDVALLLDANFNARTQGYLDLVHGLEGVDLYWLELDIYNPEALAHIRRRSRHAVASLETLFGARQMLPFLRVQSVDVAIIDVLWNGAWQAMKMANVADAHDVNVAPHNFYSHLATMMNVQFAAAVPNLQIMETDGDRLAWDDELVDVPPVLIDGAIRVPDAPGWGCVPNEETIRSRPPRPRGNFLGL